VPSPLPSVPGRPREVPTPRTAPEAPASRPAEELVLALRDFLNRAA